MPKISTSWLISLAVLVLVIVILVSFGKNITGMFDDWFGEEEKTNASEDPDTIVPDGEIDESFEPEPMAIRLREVVTDTMYGASPRCEAYQRLMAHSDPEFVMIINYYKNRYNTHLRSDMDDTWQSGCSIFSTQYDEQVYARMDELNVIG